MPETTPAKRPRKDEMASAAKLLRAEANKQRNYAEGQRKFVEMHAAAKPDTAEYCAKMARQYDARAARWDKVAEWLANG